MSNVVKCVEALTLFMAVNKLGNEEKLSMDLCMYSYEAKVG